MPDNFLINLLPDSKNIEQQYLNYIFKNPTEVYLIPEKYIYNSQNKLILNSIKKIQEQNLIFTLDEVYNFCKQENNEFERSVLDDISSKNVENIDYIKEVLKENNLKYNTILKLENVMLNATNKGVISFNKLVDSINDLYYSIHDLKKSDLKTAKQTVDNYLTVLKKRKEKEQKRTLCFNSIDKLLTKPAAPSQMTAIVGMTGGAKTTLAKNIEIKAVFSGIPVVSINLENSEEDCMDLNTCIMMNLPMAELMRKDINPRLEAKIQRQLEEFASMPNYLTYTEEELSLNQLDGLFYQAKQIFRNNGVFKDKDEYFLAILDLTEMLDEYSEARNAYEIKTVMNKIFQITRRHKGHTINLIQSNENKIRGGKIFKRHEDLDFYKIGMEDIEGSAAISKRNRVVITLTRPLQMKKRFFPEEMELWNLSPDIINFSVVKQNQGPEGFTRFGLTNTFRIYPYEEVNEDDI